MRTQVAQVAKDAAAARPLPMDSPMTHSKDSKTSQQSNEFKNSKDSQDSQETQETQQSKQSKQSKQSNELKQPSKQSNDSRDPNNPGDPLWRRRSASVVAAFRRSWLAYRAHAWGFDELLPLSRTGANWFSLGLTIVDALDSAWLMRQSAVFADARAWVADALAFDHQGGESNVFEITIRVLGGLLSAHHLSNDPVFLTKATELADRLLVAFESPTGIPYASINLVNNRAIPAGGSGGASSTAEVTTLQLEFKYLAHLTQNPKYWNVVQEAEKRVLDANAQDGLVPIYIHPDSGRFTTSEIRLGSRGDSHYEYLLKQYILTNRTESRYLFEYRRAVQGIRKHLLGMSNPNGFLFIGERPNGLDSYFSSKMDHLVCFLPATLALGATLNHHHNVTTRMQYDALDTRDRMDLDLAEELVHSCVQMYLQTPTGLAPEIVFWRDGSSKDEALATASNTNRKQQDVNDTSSAGPNDQTRAGPIRKPGTTMSLLAYHRQQIAPDAVAPYTLTVSHSHSGPPIPYDHDRVTNNATPRVPLGFNNGTNIVYEQDFSIHMADGHNLLRPETIESLYILYRITRKQCYREWGWRLFIAFDTHCRVNRNTSNVSVSGSDHTDATDDGGGYAALDDVRQLPPPHRDKMDSFFIAETLKYFYLLFSDDDLVPLTSFVFNTEAHALPVFDPRVPPVTNTVNGNRDGHRDGTTSVRPSRFFGFDSSKRVSKSVYKQYKWLGRQP